MVIGETLKPFVNSGLDTAGLFKKWFCVSEFVFKRVCVCERERGCV